MNPALHWRAMFTVLAESYLHSIDPFVMEFPGGALGGGIRWYGLSYLAGFLAGWLIIRWLAATGRSPLSVQAAGDFIFVLIAGVLLGGRLGYVLFYRPELFIEFTSSAPWWGAIAINRGGMSSHGGMAGVILAMWWFARRNKVLLRHLFDVGALGTPLGLCFGRLANFVNGELPGKALDDQWTPPGWSVKFPQQFDEWIDTWVSSESTIEARRIASEKLVSMADAVQVAGLNAGEWLVAVSGEPSLEGAALARRGAARLIDGVQRGDVAVREAVRPLLTAVYPSQLIQALTDGPLLLLIVVIAWWKPRKPGVIGCWFFIGYGVMRIATEIVRQPDAGVAIVGGLQRGQLLSLGMIAIGVFFLRVFTRSDAPLMGGLGEKAMSHEG